MTQEEFRKKIDGKEMHSIVKELKKLDYSEIVELWHDITGYDLIPSPKFNKKSKKLDKDEAQFLYNYFSFDIYVILANEILGKGAEA